MKNKLTGYEYEGGQKYSGGGLEYPQQSDVFLTLSLAEEFHVSYWKLVAAVMIAV